jgi:hypothetical protein
LIGSSAILIPFHRVESIAYNKTQYGTLSAPGGRERARDSLANLSRGWWFIQDHFLVFFLIQKSNGDRTTNMEVKMSSGRAARNFFFFF